MLLTSDPVTKIRRKMLYNKSDDTAIVQHHQDDKEILEGNKASYNSYRRASDPHGEWGDLYARIPMVVWGRLVESGRAFDEKALREWLDDRDNLVFRRRPGRLAK